MCYDSWLIKYNKYWNFINVYDQVFWNRMFFEVNSFFRFLMYFKNCM